MRQGQLFEPTASSGPDAMVLAGSRSPSSIPRRSPCSDRCQLPLASGFPSTFRNLSCIPRRSPCPDRYPLPQASGFPSISRNQQHPPTESLPESMPAPSGVRPPTKSPTSTPVYPQPHRSFQPPIQPHPFFS